VNCEFDQDHIKKSFSFPISFSGADAVKESFTLPTDKIGYWKIEASTNSSSTVFSGAAVVVKPPDYNISDPNSFFGSMLIKNFEAANRIGIKVDRHMALWGAIEKVQGTYDWSYVDAVVNRATEHHIGVMLDIVPNVGRPVKLAWATWQRDADLVNEPQHTYYINFVTALVTRYKGKLAGIELFNEPDLEYFKKINEDMDRAVDFTKKLDIESYKVIKSIDPDVPVIGLSVSGVDFRNDMQFSKAAIQGANSPMMDVFGGHGYAPGHFIDDNTPVIYPEQYDLNGKIEAVLSAMRSHGMTPRYWGTEIGYAYPFGTDPLSDGSRNIAAATAQTLVSVKSIPGAERLFWFVYSFINKNGGDKAGYTYSMFYDNGNPPYPYPVVCAYAACARVLYKTKPDGEVNVGHSMTAYRFATEDGNKVVVIWTNSGKHKLKAMNAAHVWDTYGREEATPNATVSISNYPTYFVFPASEEPRFEND
jgi:hypothetical protein